MKSNTIILILILVAISWIGYYQVTEIRKCETAGHYQHKTTNLGIDLDRLKGYYDRDYIVHRYLKR